MNKAVYWSSIFVGFFSCSMSYADAFFPGTFNQSKGCMPMYRIISPEQILNALYINRNNDCFENTTFSALEGDWQIPVYENANTYDQDKKIKQNQLYKISLWVPWVHEYFFKGEMADKLEVVFYRDKKGNPYKFEVRSPAFYGNIIDYNDKFPNYPHFPKPSVRCDFNKDLRISGSSKYKKDDYGIYSPFCDYFWKGDKHEIKLNIEYPITHNGKVLFPGGIKSFIFLINANLERN